MGDDYNMVCVTCVLEVSGADEADARERGSAARTRVSQSERKELYWDLGGN